MNDIHYGSEAACQNEWYRYAFIFIMRCRSISSSAALGTRVAQICDTFWFVSPYRIVIKRRPDVWRVLTYDDTGATVLNAMHVHWCIFIYICVHADMIVYVLVHECVCLFVNVIIRVKRAGVYFALPCSTVAAGDIIMMDDKQGISGRLCAYSGRVKNANPSTILLYINSLWPSDPIWRHRYGSTLAQVMACCLTAPSHYLNQCWLIISEVQW